VGAGFRYTKEVLTHPHAVLEFEVDVDGTWVDGVDILTCDEQARIVAFKVMLRPLPAVQLMHRRMAAMLEGMATDGAGPVSEGPAADPDRGLE